MALTQVDQGLLGTNAQYTGFKNRIINGQMAVNQYNAGTSVSITTAAEFGLDRWRCQAGANGKVTLQQTPSATETGYATRVNAGFTNYLAAVSQSAYTVGSTESFSIAQYIEGFNTADLAWGTANAKTVTLSFWAYSSLTGTFSGALANSAVSRSYPFSYTISSANTWTQISVTIAGDTSGTWVGATNGIGIRIWINLGAGSTLSTTGGAWAAGDYRATTGSVSVVGTNGATFYITGVQLEKGSTATSFDYRPYGTELVLCQRYYENNYSTGYAVGSVSNYPYNNGAFVNGYTSSSGQKFQTAQMLVQKRTSQPTNTYYDCAGNSGKISTLDSGGTQTNNVSPGVTWSSDKYLGAGPSNGTMTGVQYFWVCSAEL